MHASIHLHASPNVFALSSSDAHLAKPKLAILIRNLVDRPIEQALVEQKHIRRPNRTCRHPDIDKNTENVMTAASASVSGCLHVCECVSVLSRQSHFQNALRFLCDETPEMSQDGWPQFQLSEE